MSRRVKFGCLGSAILVLAILGGGTYFYLIRPAQAVLDDIDLLSKMAPMNTSIINQQPFSPPPGNEVSETQLASFARVQDAMKNGLGTDFELLRERSMILMGLFEEGGETKLENIGFRDAIMTIDGLGPVLVRAKEIQVAGINAEELSLAEYQWIRESFFSALGFSRSSIYFEDFAADLKKGSPDFDMDDTPPESPEINRNRAVLYDNSVASWYPFLVFGL